MDLPLVLASASPRRHALLQKVGVAFEAIPADLPEERRPGEKPEDFAARLAAEKALAVAERVGPDRVVLGADTIVVLDGDVLGKPRDAEDAVRLLGRLVGRSHRVVTSVALVAGGVTRTCTVESDVAMRPADDEELRAYAATGEPLDKAGGYGYQGEGRRFVTEVRGSETNVIGLPLLEALELVLGQRLAVVRERIAAAARRAERDPDSVTLVGASKRKSAELVAAAARAGLTRVGENYVQEARDKRARVRELLGEGDDAPSLEWHLIGRLQRNKARDAARTFDVVESLDSEALGAALDKRAANEGRRIDALLQVNLSGEEQKAGAAPERLPALLAASRDWSHLRVLGLMAIPAAGGDPRAAFARLRALRDELRKRPGGEELRDLSMGMSADFETAVEEGATIVRVGTAIFGPREN